jgi:hypothetical protein
MDIGRFQPKVLSPISGNSNNVKEEKIKQEACLATQKGTSADTVEINFTQSKEPKPLSDIAKMVNNISQMSASEAKAALSPEVVKQLVQARILE